MNTYIQCFVTIPFIVVMFQFYSWIVSLHGAQKQRHCHVLGVTYTTLGTICFIFRTLPFTVVGLLLFMLGLRLIAHGLDRINKTVFIDRFDEDCRYQRQAETAPLKVTPADSIANGTNQGDMATIPMQLDLAPK